MNVDGVICNATIASVDPMIDAPYGVIEDASLVWNAGKIVAVGPRLDLTSLSSKEIIDAKGQLLTPGFIDCHTHLVYGGDRADEFEQRLQGRSYQDIAAEGGGIMSTVNATCALSIEDLVALALPRLDRLMQSGVTSVEIKSGYGLSCDEEIKLLQAIQQLKKLSPMNIVATCLAAHALPRNFKGAADDYIDMICEQLLPEVARERLADAVDVFCETIAFSPSQMRNVFSTAQALGLAVKGHVEQLSQNHGTEVVCEYHGLSADHLEYADVKQVDAMKNADVVAVLLPGAFYHLRETQLPPVALMRQRGVAMAVATDLNPGSSPLFSITAAANMACHLFGLTPEEALSGISRHAARALGLEKQKGVLRAGADADFLLWPVFAPNRLVYELPAVAPAAIWINGKAIKTP